MIQKESHSQLPYMAYERVDESVKYLMDRTMYRPKIAIICGSGLGMTVWYCDGVFPLNIYYTNNTSAWLYTLKIVSLHHIFLTNQQRA